MRLIRIEEPFRPLGIWTPILLWLYKYANLSKKYVGPVLPGCIIMTYVYVLCFLVENLCVECFTYTWEFKHQTWFKSRQRNHNIWFIEVLKWIMCSNVSSILFFVMMFLRKYPWFYYSIMWGMLQKGRNKLIFWITYDLYRWGICKLYDLVEPFSSVWKGE